MRFFIALLLESQSAHEVECCGTRGMLGPDEVQHALGQCPGFCKPPLPQAQPGEIKERITDVRSRARRRAGHERFQNHPGPSKVAGTQQRPRQRAFGGAFQRRLPSGERRCGAEMRGGFVRCAHALTSRSHSHAHRQRGFRVTMRCGLVSPRGKVAHQAQRDHPALRRIRLLKDGRKTMGKIIHDTGTHPFLLRGAVCGSRSLSGTVGKPRLPHGKRQRRTRKQQRCGPCQDGPSTAAQELCQTILPALRPRRQRAHLQQRLHICRQRHCGVVAVARCLPSGFPDNPAGLTAQGGIALEKLAQHHAQSIDIATRIGSTSCLALLRTGVA